MSTIQASLIPITRSFNPAMIKQPQITLKRKRASLFLTTSAALLATSIYAQATPIQPAPYPLDKQIHGLIEKTMPNANIGMMVMDANTGQVLYQHRGHDHFTPASTTKLFTAAASLYHLTPDYRYKTAIYIDKKTPQHTAMPGSIYIKFSGDPSLTQKNVSSLIHQIKEKGIKKIQGNIVLDTSVYSGKPYPQGMTLGDTQWSYGAPVTSIIINRNSIPISITPSDTLKKSVNVSISGTDKNDFPLHTDVKTVTLPEADNLCEFNVVMSNENNISINGCWPISTPAYKKIAIINPTYFAKQVIRKALAKEGIQLMGTIKTGTLPKQHTLLAEHLSNPMSSLVSHMLHFSDNLYANAFLKTLGTESGGRGDFLNGVRILKKILSQHTDINFNQMTLFDGAGLSTYNLISPFQLDQLLYAVYNSPKIKTAFLHALAKPGENGTLSRRMHAIGLSDNVLAKTGSLTSTSTLAGYLTTDNHRKLIFTMMANNYVGSIDSVRMLEDQLVFMLRSTPFKTNNLTK